MSIHTFDFIGERDGILTRDPLIKSLVASYFTAFLALAAMPEIVDLCIISISIAFSLFLALSRFCLPYAYRTLTRAASQRAEDAKGKDHETSG